MGMLHNPNHKKKLILSTIVSLFFLIVSFYLLKTSIVESPEKTVSCESFDSTTSGVAKSLPVAFSVLQKPISMSADMYFKVRSFFNYNNVFQTADGNTGIRVEIDHSSKTLGMAVGTKAGFRGFVISQSIQPGAWYHLNIKSIGKKIEVYLNGDKKIAFESPDIDYKIDKIIVGSGFSGTRPFDGVIENFVLRYTLVGPSLYLLVVFLMLYLVVIVGIVSITSIPISNNSKSSISIDNQRENYAQDATDILAVLFSLLSIAVLVVLLQKYYKPDLNAIMSTSAAEFMPADFPSIFPKPVERLQYVLSLFFLPVVLLFFGYMLKRKIILKSFSSIRISAVVIVLSFFFVLAWIYLALSQNNFFFLSSNVVYVQPFAYMFVFFPIILFFVELYNRNNRYFNLISNILFALVLCFYAVIPVFCNSIVSLSSLGNVMHFNAGYYAMAAVYSGKTLLADLNSQYGLYPHFLGPIFSIIGLNVTKYTLVMASILALSFYLIFHSLKSIIKNRLILYLGLLSTVYYGYLFNQILQAREVYYQYYPIRFVFPALLLFFSGLVARDENNGFISKYVKHGSLHYYALLLVFSAGFYWNIDAGLVSAVCWLALLCYSEKKTSNGLDLLKKMSRHVLSFFFAFMLITLFLEIFLVLRTGSLVDIRNVFTYQKIFVSSGFFMLATPGLHIWNLIILFYVAGLYVALAKKVNRVKSDYASYLLVLSLLGFGTFMYYLGRSHDLTLIACWYPAFLIIAVSADYYYAAIKMRAYSIHSILMYILMLFILAAAPFSLFFNSVILRTYAIDAVSALFKHIPEPQFSNLQFIKANTVKDEKIIILSLHWDGILHTESQTKVFMNLPGSSELILKKDYEKREEILKSNRNIKVFADKAFQMEFKDIFKSNYKAMAANSEFVCYMPSGSVNDLSHSR